MFKSGYDTFQWEPEVEHDPVGVATGGCPTCTQELGLGFCQHRDLECILQRIVFEQGRRFVNGLMLISLLSGIILNEPFRERAQWPKKRNLRLCSEMGCGKIRWNQTPLMFHLAGHLLCDTQQVFVSFCHQHQLADTAARTRPNVAARTRLDFEYIRPQYL